MNTCASCGHQPEPGIFFCDKCGARLGQHTPPPTPPAQQHEQQHETAQVVSGKIESEGGNAPPQQQYPSAHGNPPQYPPLVRKQKKKRTGLIVGIIFGSVGLIAVIIFAALIYDSITSVQYVQPRVADIATPTPEPATPAPDPVTPAPDPVTPAPPPPAPPSPPPPPPSEPEPITLPPPLVYIEDLDGIWGFHSGDFVYFFGLSDYIIFSYKWDGLSDVYSPFYDDWGVVYVEDGGYTVIEGEWGIYEFLFFLDGDVLTIVDTDYDVIIYVRLE